VTYAVRQYVLTCIGAGAELRSFGRGGGLKMGKI
jgi:hypothetical protein